MDTMDGIDKNGLLNGQWTMDRDYVTPFRANPNIADPTDPTDPTDLLAPSDPSDQSEKPIDQITNSRAIPSVEAATPKKIFVLLSLDFFFLVKDFQKPDAQVTDLEALSHF